MRKYVATINIPGYLPMDDEPPLFDTVREAWQYLVSEVERSWDEYPEDDNGACVEAHTAMHNVNQDEPGTIYAPTPGYDGDHDLGLAYSVAAVEVTCAVQGTDNHSTDHVTLFDGHAEPVELCGYHASRWPALFSWEYVSK